MNNKIKPLELFWSIFSFFISLVSLIVFVISFVRYNCDVGSLPMSMPFINLFSGVFSISAFAIGLEFLFLNRKALAVTSTLLIEALYIIIRWNFVFNKYVDMAVLLVWISCAAAIVLIPTVIILIMKAKKSKGTEKY